VFNRAAIIARPIGSLLAQSYRNIEVLIVDDRSSDDIAGAVAALGDDRVRLVHREKNGGAAAARNSGVAAARGEWIAFHDSDDVCSYDKIERQVRLLLSLPEDYIGVYTAVHYYMAVDEASYSKMISYIRPFPHMAPLSGDMFRQTLNENTFNLPTLLVKKHALVAAGPSDELMRNNVDWDLAIRLTQQGKFAFIPEPLYETQIHLSQTVNKQRISRSAKFSAQSFVRITGKLRHQGFGGAPLAKHYQTTANYLLRHGRHGFARRFMRAALAMTPFKPKLWAHYVLSFLPSLHGQVRAQQKKLP
jgi:glycosyltransferase involved in cell wall biosynthesis